MTTTINADTVVGGAVVTADASGVLGLQAAGNTALTLNSSRAIGVGASPSYGTSGQVLTSAGSAAAPTWTTPVALSGTNTWTGTQSFTGSSSALGAVLTDTAETCTVSATAATGTINYDVTTQSVLYYTSNASANWTVKIGRAHV